MADDTAREEDHEPEANGEEPASAPIPDEPIPDEVAAAVVARFAGSVFVESVFSWPGMGRAMLNRTAWPAVV